jgi:hypothetical protein
MKKLILPILGVGAWIVAALIPLIAEQIKKDATDVYYLTPHKPETVGINKDLWDFDPPDPKKDPKYDRKLMEIYGVLGSEKTPTVFLDRSKLVYPAGKNPDGTQKRPDLYFLPVDKSKGENPFQVKTVDMGAKFLTGGAVITGTLFMVLFLMLRLSAPVRGARPAAAD